VRPRLKKIEERERERKEGRGEEKEKKTNQVCQRPKLASDRAGIGTQVSNTKVCAYGFCHPLPT
jgi:hypothetical protein